MQESIALPVSASWICDTLRTRIILGFTPGRRSHELSETLTGGWWYRVMTQTLRLGSTTALDSAARPGARRAAWPYVINSAPKCLSVLALGQTWASVSRRAPFGSGLLS